jgi:alpha-1,3-rhamnosyl/mannosyltransferase
MTRVAVNLLWCRPGRVGGSEQYLVRQLQGLRETTGDDFELHVYAPRGFAQAHSDLARAVQMHESSSTETLRPLRVVREATWLAARASSADLVHHGGGTIPPRSPRPTLLTVHDLQYLVYPEYFSRTKLRYLELRLPASARRADHVVVPSEYVRGTVIERLSVSADKVSVVRHGVESSIGAHRTSEAELRARFGLTASVVLSYPAITHPHKNHHFLCDLVAGPLRDADVQVVFAGGTGRAHEKLRARVVSDGLGDRIRLVGRLDDQDRDGLLAMSTALVFPSLYEGFGAPVIEAMAIGTPVIASDRTALPEVVGDAGQVIALDVDAWAGAIADAISRRDEWSRRGRERAARFRAADSGRDLAAAYRHTLRGSVA